MKNSNQIKVIKFVHIINSCLQKYINLEEYMY